MTNKDAPCDQQVKGLEGNAAVLKEINAIIQQHNAGGVVMEAMVAAQQNTPLSEEALGAKLKEAGVGLNKEQVHMLSEALGTLNACPVESAAAIQRAQAAERK